MENYRNEKNIKFISTNNAVYVPALAGTGKTTLLVDISLFFKEKKILYTALNDSIVQDAKSRFPENVVCKTIHSVAYEKVGKYYNKKLSYSFDVNQIIKYLLISNNQNKFFIANEVINKINEFCYSEYNNINDIIGFDFSSKFVKKEKLKIYLNVIWNKLIDKENNLKITHDVYLKLFQIQNGFTPLLDFDIILLDEAQDTNNCIKKIILDQHLHYNKKVIITGDPNQYIYGFRGSINLFEEIIYYPEFKKITLTQTYRFGKNIAKIANNVLDIIKYEDKLIGNKTIIDGINTVDKKQQYTIINRTNSGLLGNLLKFGKDKKIFISSKKALNFNLIMDIYFLKNNPKLIVSSNIKKFKTFENFKRFSNENNDIEYISLINIIDTYKSDIIENIKQVNKNITKKITEAEIILTTVHNAKGLEFNQVMLANDFYSPFNKNKEIKDNINIEEMYVLYTAITRAKNALNLNSICENLK